MFRRGAILIALAALAAFALGGCMATPGKVQSKMGLTIINSVDFEDYAMVLHMNREFSSAYTVYKTEDPNLAIIELPDVWRGDMPDVVSSVKVGVNEVKIEMTQTPVQVTRVVMVMEQPFDVEPIKIGPSLVLNLVSMQEKAERESARPVAVEGALLPATEITELNFSVGEEEVRFTVFGDGAMSPDVFTLPGRIILDVPGAAMNALLPDKVVSPVKAVRYGLYDDKVRIVLDMEQDGDFLATTEDNTIVIVMPLGDDFIIKRAEEVASMRAAEAERQRKEIEGVKEPAGAAPSDEQPQKPIDMASQEQMAGLVPEEQLPSPGGPQIAVPMPATSTTKAAEGGSPLDTGEPERGKKYTGKLISLDFQNADIVPIFRFIGDIAGYNVVIHPTVSGTITLKLMNVPWDQALEIILELSNLGKGISGNILTIAPSDIFVKQKESEAQRKTAEVRAAELVQVALPLKHITAQEMKTRIDEAKLMSPRGTIRIDERKNTLILNDAVEVIKKIKDEEVKYWDSPEHGTMQVLIEAKIVSVRTDYTRSLGIRWGGSADQSNFSWTNDATTVDWSVNTPVGYATPDSDLSGGLVTIGLAETIQLDVSLEALETVSKARSLANPRVLTLDRQQAQIQQGTTIPYTTAADGGGTKIETIQATLSLMVTPEVRPNGIVMLDVKVNNDKPTTIAGADQPAIDTQSVQTKALVRDGETLVLGGIYTSSEEESEVRVPWLSRIPIIGWLFKTQEVKKLPSELMIFITPTIMRG